MIFDKLTKAIESGLVVPSESFLEDLRDTVVNLELDRIANSDVDPFDIIGQHIRFGRSGLYDKSVTELLDELFDELELYGFEWFEKEDGTIYSDDFDDYLTKFLTKHFTAIDLAKIVGGVDDANRDKS